MDTSSSYTVDNTELKTLILASIQTLKRNNKNCRTEEVFQLVLESVESDIDKESLDKILGLIRNQKVETSCYANKTCLSTQRRSNKKHTTDKDNLKEHFNNFENLMINEFELMKYSFFKEVNSFKSQLLETSEIDPTRIQSQTDNVTTSSILERLIVQLQDQVSILKNQLEKINSKTHY